MTIGERIKDLRKKNDMTQEKLADFLCVSYQAVSKWECGLSSPDLSLIIPLAKLFNVSTDELLGMDKDEQSKLRKELEAAYNNTYKTGDMEGRIAIDERAIKEFPGDMEWLNRYAWDIWCAAVGIKDDNEFEAERERAIKFFDTVIENAEDTKIKCMAITGIVQCLCGKGCREEARKYVELYPDGSVTTNKKELYAMCLEGEEKHKHKQQYTLEYFQDVITALVWNGVADVKYTADTAIRLMEAVFTDGNYLYFHFEMAHSCFKKSELALSCGDLEKAKSYLKRSVYHAREYDRIVYISPDEYKFTTPIFDKITVDTRSFAHTTMGRLLDDIKNMATQECFDGIRNDENFHLYFE
ncbi:MAG: helix-turn-helix transcriptional regulator [Ruminococcaceae bacterium]|nr:helix-turn-helix transcriptional regulator [Oscillospiraceae bacterium]